MRGAVVLNVMALLVALGALGRVMVSGRQLLGAAPTVDAGGAVDAGARPDARVARDGGHRGLLGMFGQQRPEVGLVGDVCDPASNCFGAMGVFDQQGHGGLGLRGRAASGADPGAPIVLGTLDKELIRKVIHAHRAQIRSCYDTLPESTRREGKLAVRFVIAPSGAVSSAEIAESTMTPPLTELEVCVLKAVQALQFPAPKGGGSVKVTYPFAFRFAAQQ